MNEILKAAQKFKMKRFANTDQAMGKALICLGAGVLVFVGAKFLLKSYEDLTGDLIKDTVNNFKPRK